MKFRLVLASALATLAVAPALAAPPATSAKTARPASVTTPRATMANPIQRAQEKLKTLGVYSGAVDGKSSDAFVAALKKYQTQHSLSATGMVDPATSKSLGI